MFLILIGSSREGLKVDKPCEFDVMLVLKQIQDVFEVKRYRCDGPVEFVKLVKKTGANVSQQNYPALRKFLDEEETECLSSFKLMNYFKENVIKAVENITQNDTLAHLRVINISKVGCPAVTISIKMNRKTPMIHIDLVLSVQIRGWPQIGMWGQNATVNLWHSQVAAVDNCKTEYHLIAKRCPNPKHVSPNVLWLLAFNVAERKLLRPKTNGCEKQCIKVAKVILGCKRIYSFDHTIKSYHLKICAMHMMAEHRDEAGYWSKANLGPRILDLLKKLKSGIEERKLEHFFIPSLNLYDGFSEEDLDLVGKNLDFIIKELEDDPKQFCENILHSDIAMY